jgi:hypothetical protein
LAAEADRGEWRWYEGCMVREWPCRNEWVCVRDWSWEAIMDDTANAGESLEPSRAQPAGVSSGIPKRVEMQTLGGAAAQAAAMVFEGVAVERAVRG